MAVVRKLSMMIDFKNNADGAMQQANKRMDNIKASAMAADRSIRQAGQSASHMGDQFQSASRQASRHSDAMRDNASQTASASERIKQLDRQLGLQKSSLRAATAGLSDMGKESESLRRRASGLSEVVDLQKKKVDALKDRYGELKSKASTSGDELRNMQIRISEESAALGSLQGDLAKTTRSLVKMDAAERNTFKKSADKYRKIGDNMRDAGEGLTDTFGVASMAVGGALGYATKKAMDFEQAMANTKSVMDPADVGKYSAALEKLATVQGAKTKYSATEAAEAEGELLKAGLSVQDVMNGGLSGALSLATAGQLDLKSAAEIASTALNAFRRDNISVAEAADILAGAANASASDVGELNYGLQQVSTIASGAGWSFKDTATALATMAQAGLKGSDAGTSLKTMLQNLQPQTDKQAAEFKKLGIITKEGNNRFIDAQGHFKNLSQISGVLKDSLKGMSDAQRQAALEVMFGSDAIRAGNILYEAGSKGIDKMAASMDKIKAADVAKKKMDTFNGAVEQLRGSAETAGISMGKHLIPILQWFVEKGQKVVDWFNKLSPAAQRVITYTTVGTGVIMGLAAAFGILMIGVGSAIKGYSELHRVLGKITGRTSGSSAALAAQRREMEKNTIAAQNLARAESGVGGVTGGAGSAGTVGGKTKSTGKAVKSATSSGSRALSTVGKVGKVAGAGIVGLNVLTSATSLIGMNKQNAGEKVGDFGGTLGGGALGAAIGSVIAPGIGTAVGGALGAWLGGTGGREIGKAVQETSEKQAKMKPSTQMSQYSAPQITAMGVTPAVAINVKAKNDPAKKLSASVKGLVKDYNSASRTIDDKLKTIAATGGKYSDQARKDINKSYDSIVKSAQSAARSQEGSTKKHFDLLVKEGLMSKETAKKEMDTQRKNHDSKIESASNVSRQLQRLNDSYYKKMKASTNSEEKEISAVKKKYTDKNGQLTATGERKIAQIERRYADQRRKISQDYSGKRTDLEKKLKNNVAGVLSKSAQQQKIILGKLRDSSGKLSAQQASKIIKEAKKAKDGAVSAANKKYNDVMAAADQEYYVTGSISKKQYEEIKKKAEDQRDSAISAANDQFEGTVEAAKKQSSGLGDEIDWQTGKVFGFWDKVGKRISDAWNWITKLFTGKSAGITFGTKSGGSSEHHALKRGAAEYASYATGTDLSGHPGGAAILGDGGKPELWITPQGCAGISPAVPTLYQDMPRGTQVLNGDDTERILGARAYEKGTSGFWSSIGDFFGKGFEWLKNGASSAANWVLKKFGLDDVSDVGILTRFTQKTAWPAVKKLVSGSISRLAHSFDFSGGVSGGGKAWIPMIQRAAAMSNVKLTGGMISAIVNRINKESGGNQTVRQKIVDINSRAGHPAQGLLQYIPSTFSTWARPGHTNILSGFDQLLAMFNNSNWYRDIRAPGGWGPTGKRRYAQGTRGAGAWAERVFGPRRNKDRDDGSGRVGVVSSRPVTINAPVTVNINVSGGGNVDPAAIAKMTRQEIEKAFQNLKSQLASGVVI